MSGNGSGCGCIGWIIGIPIALTVLAWALQILELVGGFALPVVAACFGGAYALRNYLHAFKDVRRSAGGAGTGGASSGAGTGASAGPSSGAGTTGPRL